ncbi:MAG: bifunctional [glutamate--ammonia ligase]-adenylyl-L-tyrosine phosphorylase/[glutamate--ammonia-ligase] adenylyltransferase [Desulfomonile tiedjei]|nr:bifunctional [glutamate--ammonia ligase]-adenylyl-L-tyrosine phosphorylase/[glutamate--ammonia-ligase] adenylyltransferase [Desulfomonile tiedjei]
MAAEPQLTDITLNLPALADFMSRLASETRTQLTAEILDSPNAKATAGRMDDLLRAPSTGLVTTILCDSEMRMPFLAVVGGSRFLFSILLRNPHLLESLFLSRGYELRKSRGNKDRELRERLGGISETDGLDRVLRLYKEEDYLRTGCRDLAGLAGVVEVMEELSDLAAASIQAAVSFHQRRLNAKHGLPPGVEEDTGFVVMGLGKVSGKELNFSSDVDIMYLRGPEEGQTQGPASVTVAKYYETLAQSVSRSLSEVTEDGFVFRVDLRLRPEGEKGELVPSVNNALDYYLGWGRTWERAALMKAVPIAGDVDLGQEFIAELEPFLYRKYLDYSTLEDMRVMKLGIESQLRRKPVVNIKLGQGGIREIEFFVQTLQLINAGRTGRVRSPSTLKALDLLEETDLLEEQTVANLKAAYLFFRKTEHCIQINHQLQTHELPRTREDQEELARRMGYKDGALETFLSDLDRHRKIVEELFSTLFYHAGDETFQQVSARTKAIAENIEDEKATEAMLAEYGLEGLAGSYPILRNLIVPPESKIPSEKGRRLLERLAPLFLEEIAKMPEPRQALIALDSFIDSLTAHAAYFSTLLENPPTVGFLINILGESKFFTELLIHHPQALDSLIARGAQKHPLEKADLEAELSERLAYCEDLESALDVLRRFKHEQMLNIGVRHLSGEIESPAARWLVTELAEACLEAAVRIAFEEMTRKFGGFDAVESLPFVIIGMGKLGGMEMTYLSDLDVIFVYDFPSAQIGRFSAHEWFTRLASRIISILTVPTAEGTVFAIDTRLRPSGNKGPLVSSLSSFRDYHKTTSELWEKQALTKARPVTGPVELAGEVEQIIRDCIMRTRISSEDIREIDRLRKRMQSELAVEDELRVDLKTGHGGLVDVEFFVQANILKHACVSPSILVNNTLEALAEFYAAGLIDRGTFRTLDSGYRFLSNLEDRLRIMEQRSVNSLPLRGEKLKGLARRLGYGENGEGLFLQDYFEVTDSIRKIYDSFFGEDADHLQS